MKCKKHENNNIQCNDCKHAIINNIINLNDGYLLFVNQEISGKSLIDLKCNNGHAFQLCFTSLKRNIWCQDCSLYKSEKICKLYFEQIFGVSFKKCRPNFLKQLNGYNLELDGFNEELKIAFEHQGGQHFKIIKNFKMTQNDLKEIQRRDKFKIEKCIDENIKLFVIPQITTMTKVKNLKDVILNQSINFNIEHLGNFEIEIDFSKLYDKTINIFKGIATDKGGTCTSKLYVDLDTILDFICVRGHKFSQPARDVRYSNAWCSACSKEDRNKETLAEFYEIAKSHGGECLSTVYLGPDFKLDFRCKYKHDFSANAEDVRYSHSWCSVCFGTPKQTIEQMQEMARSRGGECLSEEYIDAHHHLLWRCKYLHIWPAKPCAVKNSNTWCRECSEDKPTIEAIHAIAKSKGGMCFSKEYKNSKINLDFECANKHKFSISYSVINKLDRWCKYCAAEKRKAKRLADKQLQDSQ